MPERSFRKEVEKLRVGAGETFSGEGILAITKALLQSGVAYVGGYQGSPISHLMDVLADAEDILNELGVHFETSASEATAAAMRRPRSTIRCEVPSPSNRPSVPTSRATRWPTSRRAA
jgi:indolepyruvate ferredoxin oxidoreductase alpha subunit